MHYWCGVQRFGILLRSLPQNKLRGPEAETRELETITYAASSCQLETARTLGSSARVELRSEWSARDAQPPPSESAYVLQLELNWEGCGQLEMHNLRSRLASCINLWEQNSTICQLGVRFVGAVRWAFVSQRQDLGRLANFLDIKTQVSGGETEDTSLWRFSRVIQQVINETHSLNMCHRSGTNLYQTYRNQVHFCTKI